MHQHDLVLEVKAILAGLLGGGKYGVKIRLPHALVMTLLFRRNLSAQDKLKIILKSTFEHSKNLASFAAIYKVTLFALKWVSTKLHTSPAEKHGILFNIGRSIAILLVDGPHGLQHGRINSSDPGIAEHTQHAAIAGFLGGYSIWGKYSSINYQIVLYLTSRILTGLILLAREKRIKPFHLDKLSFDKVYPVKAAFVWATVMALFESYPHVLHPSLKKSMDEVYRS